MGLPAAVLAGAAAVLLLGLLAAGVGLRGGEPDESGPALAPPTSAATATAPSSSASVPPVREPDRDRRDGPDIEVRAADPDVFPPEPVVVDALARRTVLRITVRGFAQSAVGEVDQCAQSVCTNSYPVTFDQEGNARFQYLLRDRITAGPAVWSTCRATAPPCIVRIRTETDTAYLTTVFRDHAPPPRRVTVSPRVHGLVDGAEVTVTASGFTPGARVNATLCAAPATSGTARCGAPSAVAPFTIGADGGGRTTLVVRTGRVGSDEVLCGRSAGCGVVVREESGAVLGAVAAITFGTGPGAHYVVARVVGGGALAALFLALAWLLIRGTDWRKPTEADTPELDRAVL